MGEEADSRIIRHAINLKVNDYKEVSIQTVDSFCAIIVKDAGVEKRSVVYERKEKYFWMCLIIWLFWGGYMQSVTLLSHGYRMRDDIQFLSSW